MPSQILITQLLNVQYMSISNKNLKNSIMKNFLLIIAISLFINVSGFSQNLREWEGAGAGGNDYQTDLSDTRNWSGRGDFERTDYLIIDITRSLGADITLELNDNLNVAGFRVTGLLDNTYFEETTTILFHSYRISVSEYFDLAN